MNIDLLPWLEAWAILTTIIVMLAVYRWKLASHEVTGIHIVDSEADLPDIQEKFARTINKVEFCVKWLSVVSAVMIVGIGVVLAYQGYSKLFGYGG